MATKTSDQLLDTSLLKRTIDELWWMGAIQGVLAVFFGITAIFWPALTLVTLVYLFSAFILAIGMTEIVLGIISINRRSTWWVTLLIGIVSLVAGIYLVRHPDVSFATFILVIGLTLIARGVLDVIRAFIDRATTTNKVLLTIIGIAAIVAGIIILLQPVAGGVAFVWVLGIYGLILGALELAIAFEMRRELEPVISEPANPKRRVTPREA
jgi:uncharacterized membrane protein HdeD (DUF308 family)